MHSDQTPQCLPVTLVALLGGGDDVDRLWCFVLEVIRNRSMRLSDAYTSTEDAAVMHLTCGHLLVRLKLEHYLLESSYVSFPNTNPMATQTHPNSTI